MQLCYTPMITADVLLKDVAQISGQMGIGDGDGSKESHRHRVLRVLLLNGFDPANVFTEAFTTTTATEKEADTSWDRPLIAQLAANTPTAFLEAALLLQKYGGIDAIDLNLGCPQARAERDNFGAFLLRDHLDTVCQMIRTAATSADLKLPVTVKIRRSGTVEQTVAVAKALADAGASLICIHGRPIDMKNHQGDADHSHAAAVVAELLQPSATTDVSDKRSVPVVANGHIWSHRDAQHVLTETRCSGVMMASALLRDPFLCSSAESSDTNRQPRSTSGSDHHPTPKLPNVAAALKLCRLYLQQAARYVPRHPKTIKDHLLTFLRAAIAPKWKRPPNSGDDTFADIWIAMEGRYVPGRTRLVRRKSGKVAIKHGPTPATTTPQRSDSASPASLTDGKQPAKRLKMSHKARSTSTGTLRRPSWCVTDDTQPVAIEVTALKFFTELVDEIEQRYQRVQTSSATSTVTTSAAAKAH